METRTLRRYLAMSLVIAIAGSLVTTGCKSSDESAVPPVETEIVDRPTATPAALITVAPNFTVVPDHVVTSSLERVRQSGVLRVGILYNYPPLAFLSENGKLEGYEAALIEEIASRWEVEVEFIQVTRQTRLPMLLSGEIDVLAGAVPHTRDLEQFVDFSITQFQSGFAVLTSVDSGFVTVPGIGSRNVAAIGSEAADVYRSIQEQNGITPSVEEFPLEDEALAAFEDGSVSAIVGRRETLMRLSSVASETLIFPDMLSEEPYGFAVLPGDTPMRDLLNLTLMSMVVDGSYGSIYAEHLYAYTPDEIHVLPGDVTLNFDNMPVDIPQTESVLARLQRGETLRVAGINLDDDPELFDGQPIVDSFARAIINEIARRWNVPVTEIPDSAGENGLAMLDSGEADMVIGVAPTMSGVGHYGFSLGVYERGLRLLHLNDVTVNGVGDLEYKPSIAMQPVDISEDIIRDNNSAPDIQSVTSLEEAFDTLVARGTYALVGDEFSAALMVQAEPSIEVYETRYRAAPQVIAIANTDVDFMTLINITLQDLYADGTLERLHQDYLAPYLLPDDDEDREEIAVEIWPGSATFLNLGVYVP